MTAQAIAYYLTTVSMKKIFFYSLIFMASVLASCSEKKVEVPVDILSNEKMIAVLTDVEIAEAAKNQHVLMGDTIADFTAASFKFIFDKHKVNAADFQRSMDWYAAHPDMLNKIYEEVVNSLSKKQSEVAN